MPKESFVELVAEKRCLFRPTAGHFNYQWWWVMQRDFPPLPLSSHPIWLWWQWDFGDRSISQSTLLSSSKMNVARTRVGSENSGSSAGKLLTRAQGNHTREHFHLQKMTFPSGSPRVPSRFAPLRCKAKGTCFSRSAPASNAGAWCLLRQKMRASGCGLTVYLPGTRAGTVAQPTSADISLTP